MPLSGGGSVPAGGARSRELGRPLGRRDDPLAGRGPPRRSRTGWAGGPFGGRGRREPHQGVEAGHRGGGGVPGQVWTGDLWLAAPVAAGHRGLGSAEPAAAENFRHPAARRARLP